MAANSSNQQRMEELLDRLSTLRVEGPSRGGPHVGIVHNDLTRKILATGKPIVPHLIARLPDSSFEEAVYIVFLLRELRATEAQPAVRQLQSEVGERSVGKDLTLKMQIQYFLRDVHTW